MGIERTNIRPRQGAFLTHHQATVRVRFIAPLVRFPIQQILIAREIFTARLETGMTKG
jgi:hypothetical protein